MVAVSFILASQIQTYCIIKVSHKAFFSVHHFSSLFLQRLVSGDNSAARLHEACMFYFVPSHWEVHLSMGTAPKYVSKAWP